MSFTVIKHIICELTGYKPGTVDVSQGDRGSRAVSCRLMENGTPWMIPEGATARVAYTLPDGTEGLYDNRPDGTPMWEIAGNIVTVELADRLMAQAGMAQVSILVIGPEGGQLATWPIRVMVTANKAARLTVPENMPPYGAGFVGKIFFGGEDGIITPLIPGEGVEIVRLEGGSYALVASAGAGGGITEEADPTVAEWAKAGQPRPYGPNNVPPYPVTSVNGKGGEVKLTAEDVGAMPQGTKIPGKTSDLTNDAGFVTTAVNDLANYYTKTQTQELIAAIPRFRVTVVQQLPAAGEEMVLYLVPFTTESGEYLEYLWMEGRWEVIGTQWIDLAGYATEEWTLAQLGGLQPKGDYLRSDAQTLTADQQEQARTNIGAVSRKEVEDLLGIIEEDFSVSGELVEFDVDVEPDTELNVVSKIHRDETWGESNKLVLHQVSGDNFVDLSSYLGGAGKVFEKNGLTATINADSTLTVAGTNTATGWTNIVNITDWSSEYSRRVYPAGTYRIPAGFKIQIRAAQYPGKVTIEGLSSNLSGTIVVAEPFRIVSMIYAVAGGATVDTTVPLGLFYGGEVPASEYRYSGSLHTVAFDTPVYEGEFNWRTGELKDVDGNTVAYYEPHSIKKLTGVNYFWTGFGENTVSNASSDLGKVVLRLNEPAPEETVPSICDFTLTPTTPEAAYGLFYSAFLPNGKFHGNEVPVLTTKGTLSVQGADGNVKYSKYIGPMFNTRGVSDVLTHKGLEKKWSGKFYLTKDPVSVTKIPASTTGSIDNYVFVWEFEESEFANTGVPAKIHDIAMASPCFVNNDNSENNVNAQALWNSTPYPAFFSYNAETGKYTLTARGIQGGSISAQLTAYSKVHFYYQLETPYNLSVAFAMGIAAGDMITFEADLADNQPYIEALSAFKDRSVDPAIAAFVPRNVDDAMDGMSNAARMLNTTDAVGGDATVQGYSWIGAGDGTTDYTTRIQAKLDELHSVSNGGTIHLGPGTYPISKSLIVYRDTQIIGDGHTVIEQMSDNTHAVVWDGSNIRMCDLTVRLSGKCTEITACIFANSNNTGENRDERYPENFLVAHCSTSNVTLIGTYRFSWDEGNAYLSEEALAYRGVGICADKMYFNFYDCAGLTCQHLYAAIYGGGGGNNYRICVTESRFAVHGGGGNNLFDINGHTYHEGGGIGTDYVFYGVRADSNTITIGFYDPQYSKGVVYFTGKCQRNHYTIFPPVSNINNQRAEDGQLYLKVEDYGRNNAEVQPVNESYVGVGSYLSCISGLPYWNTQFNPSIHNALAGAGVWGNIESNKEWTSNGIGLADVCRYPKETAKAGFGLASVVCDSQPSEESPVEITIDISDRPTTGYEGFWIQFDHRFVAENYTVSFDTTDDGVFNFDAAKVVGNNQPVSYRFNYQIPSVRVYRIKISITKALQIPDFVYLDAGYGEYTINYNPDGLVGIVNIGMPSNEAYGRAFLAECGGSLYGNVDMHRNALKNLPAPVDDGDAVNKAHLEAKLAELEAKLAALTAIINGT